MWKWNIKIYTAAQNENLKKPINNIDIYYDNISCEWGKIFEINTISFKVYLNYKYKLCVIWIIFPYILKIILKYSELLTIFKN